MASKKKGDTDSNDLLGRVQNSLVKVQAGARGMGACEIVETIIDAFDTPLFLTQRLLLKVIFAEDLDGDTLYSMCGAKNGVCLNRDGTPNTKCPVKHTELLTEQGLMDKWVALEKTNWQHPATVLGNINMAAALGEGDVKQKFIYQNITLQCGMRCLSGDSLIYTEADGYVYLNELLPTAVDTELEIPLFSRVHTRFGAKPVTRGLSRPAAEVFNLRSRYGFELGGSAEHPLLVLDKNGQQVWKKMPDITRGDFICVARKPLENDRPDPVFSYRGVPVDPQRLARVVGLLVGDGSVTTPTKTGLTTMDADIAEEFTGFCSDVAQKDAAKYTKPNNLASSYELHSKEFRAWLAEVVGLDYNGAYDKVIPRFVRQASRESLRQFLRGLFDTDGFAASGKTCVAIALASETLIKQIQTMLLGFGILSSRTFHEVDYTRQDGRQSYVWKLEMNGPEAIAFGRLIGFGLARKQAVVDGYTLKPGYGSRVDKIPNLTEMLRDMKLREGHSTKGSGKAAAWGTIRRQCSGTTRRVEATKGAGITYRLLPDVINYFDGVAALKPEVDYLRELQDQNLFYDEVVETWQTHEPVYDICVPGVSEYVANGVVSHNSSKSSLVGLVNVIKFFKLITSDNPQRDHGIPTSSAIYLTVIASTERQALGTIFFYVKSYIEKSTYFKQLIKDGKVIVNELQIEFPDKNIIIASGHSRATSIVGRTALLTSFDELAMFSADDEHTSNAADVYQRVGMSLMTFPNDGQRIALSSVKEQGDYMEVLCKEDWDRQTRGCVVFDLTTFDVNPIIKRNDAQVASVYDKDPVVAERDFENIRPGAASAFLNADLIARACEGFDPQQNVVYRPQPLYRVRGEGNARTELDDGDRRKIIEELGPNGFHETSGLEVTVLPVDWSQANFIESIGHCDIGLINDSFAFACGHAEWSPAGVVTVIDVVLEWIPRSLGKGKAAKVDLIQAEDVISRVAKARRMTKLSFDQWNSESSIQRLYNEGVETRSLSFARGQQTALFDNLKQLLALGLIRFPKHPSLIEELENLVLKNGQTIDHPRKKESKIPGKIAISKDSADCIAVIAWEISKQGRDFVRGQIQQGPMLGHTGSVRAIAPTQALNRIGWRPR